MPLTATLPPAAAVWGCLESNRDARAGERADLSDLSQERSGNRFSWVEIPSSVEDFRCCAGPVVPGGSLLRSIARPLRPAGGRNAARHLPPPCRASRSPATSRAL